MLRSKKLLLFLFLLLLVSIFIHLNSKTIKQFGACLTKESRICKQEATADCYNNCGGEENCKTVYLLGGQCDLSICWQDYYWECTDGTWGILYDCVAADIACPW